jgi:DNA (cytosine-5)-methyltransferase 1
MGPYVRGIDRPPVPIPSGTSMTVTVGSLFSGIGGLDLGLERAGMEIRWNCEIDQYCCRILQKWWPDVPNLGDVTAVDWSTVERVDLICGGYPCQPFSYAGKRGGADDPRHLWPHFASALRHLRPRFAILENVPGHLSLGFGRVLGDLAELGFDAEWDCIPAAAVGAPHLRYRVFVVAYASGARRREDAGGASGHEGQNARGPEADDHVADGDGEGGRAWDVAAADGAVGDTVSPSSRTHTPRQVDHGVQLANQVGGTLNPTWVEWLMGFPPGWTDCEPSGTAVVPQVAQLIGERIMGMHDALVP